MAWARVYCSEQVRPPSVGYLSPCPSGPSDFLECLAHQRDRPLPLLCSTVPSCAVRDEAVRAWPLPHSTVGPAAHAPGPSPRAKQPTLPAAASASHPAAKPRSCPSSAALSCGHSSATTWFSALVWGRGGEGPGSVCVGGGKGWGE